MRASAFNSVNLFLTLISAVSAGFSVWIAWFEPYKVARQAVLEQIRADAVYLAQMVDGNGVNGQAIAHLRNHFLPNRCVGGEGADDPCQKVTELYDFVRWAPTVLPSEMVPVLTDFDNSISPLASSSQVSDADLSSERQREIDTFDQKLKLLQNCVNVQESFFSWARKSCS